MGFSITIDLKDKYGTKTVLKERNVPSIDVIKIVTKWRARKFKNDISYVYLYVDNYDGDRIKKRYDLQGYGKIIRFVKTFCEEHDAAKITMILRLKNTRYRQLIPKIELHRQEVYDSLVEKLHPKRLDKVSASQIKCEELVGIGGFGIVFKGYYNEEQVAVKMIPLIPVSNDSHIFREVFILEHLNKYKGLSDYVVKFYECFIDDNFIYIILEYLPGPNINNFIATHTHTDIKKIHSVCNHIIKGLQKIHLSGIIHRDIKPDNIMGSVDGSFKFVDFGFAIFQDTYPVHEDLKTDHHIVGTYRFSPPEVLSYNFKEKKKIDWMKSDLWSLGTVIYYIITGEHLLTKSSRDRNELTEELEKITFPVNIKLSKYLENSHTEKYKRQLKNMVYNFLTIDPEKRMF